MIRSRIKDRIFKGAGMVMDMTIFAFIYYWIWSLFHSHGQLSFSYLTRIRLSSWQFFVLILLILVLASFFSWLGMYNLRSTSNLFSWVRRIALAATWAAGLTIAAVNLIGVKGMGSNFSIFLWGSFLFFFTTYRLLLLQIVYIVRQRGRNLRYIVIIGLSNRSIMLWKKMRKVQLGYIFQGFIDDIGRKQITSNSHELKFLCPLEEFTEYISNHPVDEIWIALPMKSYYDIILDIIKESANQGIKTRLLTDLFDLPSNIQTYIGKVSEVIMIDYDTDIRSEIQYDLKRIWDIFFSLTAILLLSPVFITISAAIIFSDGWPIIFSQERIGWNKRRFNVYKFRTMVNDASRLQDQLEAANQADGAVFKIQDDPRVTKLGKFLRKTSLDELPQFFNILKGDMSLVGPRPLPIRDFERFYNPGHRLRFSVKPGLTGLWQISGRSDVSFEEWMKLDIFYVKNWSLYMDMRIILQTVWVVVTMKGAY